VIGYLMQHSSNISTT